MTQDQYVLLGLGQARASWLGSVSRWTTAGAIPAEFFKCVSASELRQRLSTMRQYSAVLVEADASGLDRDLIHLAAQRNVPTIVVEHKTSRVNNWLELGAAAVLPAEFTPAELLYALATYTSVVRHTNETETSAAVIDMVAPAGELIAVCGPGGTGASTVAIALAQERSSRAIDRELVLLADFARNAEQAMLHDAQDITPGIEELIDAHRTRRASVDDVRSLTFSVSERGYRLLLGLRRSETWSAMPPRSLEASISGLRRAFTSVVVDITADFEGEAEGGSIDVEERNAPARLSVMNAGVVVVVGCADMKGVHSLARTIRQITSLEVAPERILPVINRAQKSGAAHADAADALRELTNPGLNAPVFVPERPVDQALRDGVRLPKAITEPIADGVDRLLMANRDGTFGAPIEPARIKPGELGFLEA